MRKRYMVVLAVIGILFLCYVEGWGADWKIFSLSDAGTAYYDAENIIRPSKGVVRVWQKTVYNEKSVINAVEKWGDKYKTFSYSITLWELYCAEKKERLLSSTHYSTDGGVLFSATDQESKWNFIVPDSEGELLYKAVCK